MVEINETKKKTAQGIFLPETSSGETPQEGKVAAVGENKEIKVKKGQSVIFRRYSGTDVEVGGKKYVILKNEDILATVK